MKGKTKYNNNNSYIALYPVKIYKLAALKMCVLVVVVDRFYIALFSALKQTHCALLSCDSK